MSYNDDLAKLQRLLNKTESLVSDFTISKTVTTDYAKESMKELAKLLESLNYKGWRFSTEGFAFGDIHVYSSIPCRDGVVQERSYLIEVTSHSKRHLKKEIVQSMLKILGGYHPVNLDVLADQVLKPAEVIEARITESLCSDIYDICKDFIQSFAALEKEWNTAKPSIVEYENRINQLLVQISDEYFNQKLIVKGDYLCRNTLFAPYEVVEDMTGDEVVVRFPNQKIGHFGVKEIPSSDRVATWKKNHPQFHVDELLEPLDAVRIALADEQS